MRNVTYRRYLLLILILGLLLARSEGRAGRPERLALLPGGGGAGKTERGFPDLEGLVAYLRRELAGG